MKIQCNNCKDIIESKHRHDWQCCSCYTSSREALHKWEVENDYDYDVNYIGVKRLRTTEYWDHVEKTLTGCFIDGGDIYHRIGGNNYTIIRNNQK